MRKFLFSLFLATVGCIAVTSCNEEEIKPSDSTSNYGGGGSGSTGPY